MFRPARLATIIPSTICCVQVSGEELSTVDYSTLIGGACVRCFWRADRICVAVGEGPSLARLY
jgi:hypothetical protein